MRISTESERPLNLDSCASCYAFPHMKLTFFISLVFAVFSARAQDYSASGPYAVGVRTVTVTRPNATTFTARLSYPATSAGSSTPFASVAAPAPAISFGHGFVQATSQYATTMDHLASWGFIVIASNSETSLFPSHGNFAADLRHALTYLEQQNAASGSFIFGSVNTAKFGMSGHSMGGGASILATADDVRVKALANLAAAETNPSAISAMSRIRVPVSLIAGDADTIVPVSSNGQSMYNAGSAPKSLPIIRGGFHCGFTDASFFGCDSSATLTRAQQLPVVRRLLTQFFMLTLKDEQSLWSSVWGPVANSDAAVNHSVRTPGSRIDATSTLIQGGAFSIVQLPMVLTNTGSTSRAFRMFGEGLSISFSPAITGIIPAGGSANLIAVISYPANSSQLPSSIVISARAEDESQSRSFVSVATQWRCISDFNVDGASDGDDVIAFFGAWDTAAASADLNADGGVDGDDVIIFFDAWDTGC